MEFTCSQASTASSLPHPCSPEFATQNDESFPEDQHSDCSLYVVVFYNSYGFQSPPGSKQETEARNTRPSQFSRKTQPRSNTWNQCIRSNCGKQSQRTYTPQQWAQLTRGLPQVWDRSLVCEGCDDMLVRRGVLPRC